MATLSKTDQLATANKEFVTWRNQVAAETGYYPNGAERDAKMNQILASGQYPDLTFGRITTQETSGGAVTAAAVGADPDGRQRLVVEIIDNGAPLGAGVTSDTILAALESSYHGGGAGSPGASASLGSSSARPSARSGDPHQQQQHQRATSTAAAAAATVRLIKGARAQRTSLVLPFASLLADAIGGAVHVSEVQVQLPAPTSSASDGAGAASPGGSGTVCRVVRFAFDFPFTLPSEAERSAVDLSVLNEFAVSSAADSAAVADEPPPLPWGGASRSMPSHQQQQLAWPAPAVGSAAFAAPGSSRPPPLLATPQVWVAFRGLSSSSASAGDASTPVTPGGGRRGSCGPGALSSLAPLPQPLAAGGRAPRAVVGLDGQSLGMHVLLVDDMGVIRRQGEVFLEQLGCTAITLEDGDEVEAAMHAATRPFDAIVMDIAMTRTDGAEVCRTLRQDFGVRCPIVAMTGSVTTKDMLRYYAMGFDVVLPKPFTRDAMGRALAEGRQRCVCQCACTVRLCLLCRHSCLLHYLQSRLQPWRQHSHRSHVAARR